jgi:hypothetical protein
MPVTASYIEFELEHPNEGSQDIEFTNTSNNAFYIHLKLLMLRMKKHKIEH